MSSINNIENLLNQQFDNLDYTNSIISEAVLKTQIISIDTTLFQFRDLAGRQLHYGNADVMVRYREFKTKLEGLISLYEEKTGSPFDIKKLKC